MNRLFLDDRFFIQMGGRGRQETTMNDSIGKMGVIINGTMRFITREEAQAHLRKSSERPAIGKGLEADKPEKGGGRTAPLNTAIPIT